MLFYMLLGFALPSLLFGLPLFFIWLSEPDGL
jgi:hypothetical protein